MTQVASIAACLPEQFIWIEDLAPPDRISSSLVSSSSGQSAGVCRADSSRPTEARMRRTPSMWKGSPEWEAQESASSSSDRGRPTSSMPSAWTGLLHERGSIGSSTSPALASTEPSRSSTTQEP